MADTAEVTANGQSKSNNYLKIILLVSFSALLVIGISVGLTIYLVSGNPVGSASTGAAEDSPEAEETIQDPPIYLALHPALVVNFQNPRGARFLQVSVEVMARNEAIIEAVKQHMPVIRNSLISLFSSQEFKTISTREGKEALRQEVLAEVQQILEQQTGEPGVEDVYFTSFVMQ